MIDAITTHQPTISRGFYTIGSGPTHILILGSCRIMPYVNYFTYLNDANAFTVHVVDVVRYHFDAKGERVPDVKAVLDSFESKPAVIDMFKSVKWFIHEHTANYGLFNTERDNPKNIYQFGMKAEIDVGLPNFNNHFILFQDLVSMDREINQRAKALKGVLDLDLKTRIKNRGLDDVDKFCRLAALTDLPQMADLFRDTWRKTRYFWNCNHITKHYTIAVFKMLLEKLLVAPTPAFWTRIGGEDMYENPHTPVTPYDVEAYGIEWPEQVKPLTV